MDSNQLLTDALSIQDPWFVEDIEFDPDQKKLEIDINFIKGSTFRSSNPDIEGAFKAYDTQLKKWRHMNFFEHECYRFCWTPRIKTGEHTSETVSPPWAGLNAGFSMLFEALLLQLCSATPVHQVAKVINVSDNKIWRLLDKYTDTARNKEDPSEVTILGIDETSKSKGHHYISLFVDLKKKENHLCRRRAKPSGSRSLCSRHTSP